MNRNTAHYKGNCTDFSKEQIFGPDTCGAYYRAISATYDPETNITTIQFKPYLGEVIDGD